MLPSQPPPSLPATTFGRRVSRRGPFLARDRQRPVSHLEPFVLKHLLDGHQLAGVAQLGLVDDAEGAVADDFGVRVADLLRPVGPLARGGHHCRYLAAVFIP